MFNRIKSLLKFVLTNFGPMVAYIAVNHFLGAKPAIIAGLIAAFAEVAFCIYKRQRPSAFFLFTTITTIAFGFVDLYQETPFLLRYEAVVTNVITGVYFLGTLLLKKTVIQEFAEKAANDSRQYTGNRLFYVRLLTWVWGAYFFVKAGFYAWVITVMPFEEAIAVRAMVGKVSLIVLIAGEQMFRRQIVGAMARLNLLPEPRTPEQVNAALLS